MDVRFEYYWLNGQVVEFKNKRALSHGRWPIAPYKHKDQIAILQRIGLRTECKVGPMESADRLAEALLRFNRCFCNGSTKDLGLKVPKLLLKKVSTYAKSLAEKTTAAWEVAGDEPGLSGLLAGLEPNKIIEDSNWKAKIRIQVFSPITKEPHVGADIGIIIDIGKKGDGANRTVKAALIQAKKTEGQPSNPMKLPRLKEQIADMQKTTMAAFAFIFSDEKSYVIHPHKPHKQIAFDTFLSDMVSCKYGDRKPVAVAQAYDRSIVIDVKLQSD